MCNACGYLCCASDCFDKCGCDCSNQKCWAVCEYCGSNGCDGCCDAEPDDGLDWDEATAIRARGEG